MDDKTRFILGAKPEDALMAAANAPQADPSLATPKYLPPNGRGLAAKMAAIDTGPLEPYLAARRAAGTPSAFDGLSAQAQRAVIDLATMYRPVNAPTPADAGPLVGKVVGPPRKRAVRSADALAAKRHREALAVGERQAAALELLCEHLQGFEQQIEDVKGQQGKDRRSAIKIAVATLIVSALGAISAVLVALAQ